IGRAPWLLRATRSLPRAVAIAVLALICYELGSLTWLLVPPPSPDPIPVHAAATTAEPPADFSALGRAHLFGEAPPAAAHEPEPVVEAAPETTLQLTLKGLLSEPDSAGRAIIASGASAEKTYSVGEPIDAADGVILHAVLADRVLLDRGGILEALHFPE